jgi:hypothetical protein
MKILITDSLFIEKDHENILTDAGFILDRLDKPKASEEELVERIVDKDYYILGGSSRLLKK